MQNCFINSKAKLCYKQSLSTRRNCATAAYPEWLQDLEPPGVCSCPFLLTTPAAELQILGANRASGRHVQQTARSPGIRTLACPSSAWTDLTSFWRFYVLASTRNGRLGQRLDSTKAVPQKAAGGIQQPSKERAGRAARAAAAAPLPAVAMLSHGRLAYRAIFKVHCFWQEINSNGCLVSIVETVVHKPGDQRGLPNALLAQEDELELPQRVPEVAAAAGAGHEFLVFPNIFEYGFFLHLLLRRAGYFTIPFYSAWADLFECAFF